jgi:hypothetical protein
MASEDAPLIGHVASLRKLAVELRDAIAGATMQQRVADRVNQIARALEVEANQLEKIARTKS